jgi:hypothetical protein
LIADFERRRGAITQALEVVAGWKPQVVPRLRIPERRRLALVVFYPNTVDGMTTCSKKSGEHRTDATQNDVVERRRIRDGDAHERGRIFSSIASSAS